MNDEEYLRLAYGDMYPEAENADDDPWAGMVPARTVTMRRTFPTYAETMTINGYPAIRRIIITFPDVRRTATENPLPGVIRELPVGYLDMRSAEAFIGRLERTVQSYETEGWKRA